MDFQSFFKMSIIWFCAALVPLTLGGNSFITKKALGDGMRFSIYVFYRNFIAALALLPCIIIKRNSLPNMSKKAFGLIILLTVLEPVMSQNFFYAGLKFTPVNFSSIATALVPAMTFIGSWIFRLEVVHVGERRSQAKLLGTAIMTMGAIIGGFYAGPTIVISSSDQNQNIVQKLQENWVRGPTLITAALISAVLYNIVLGKTLKLYPAPLAVTGFVCIFGAALNLVIAAGLEGGSRFPWLIVFDMKMLAYFYGGLVVSCLTSYLQGWLTKMRGPVFYTSFTPLSVIVALFVATMILKENIVLGRMIEVFFLLCGLTILLWGKRSQGTMATEGQDGQDEQATEGQDEQVEVKIEPPIHDSAEEAEEDLVLQCDETEPAKGDVHVRECRSEQLQTTSLTSRHVLKRSRTI